MSSKKKKKQVLKNKGWKYTIIYEDRDIVVVNKPAGLLCVPIPHSKADNLLQFLKRDLRHKSKEVNTVHRIDRYTSGIVVFAKNKPARHKLIQQFLSHTPKRTYLSLVRNRMENNQDTLVHYLKRIKSGFRNIVVSADDPKAGMARLSYKVMDRFPDTTLVEIELDTGLKNQIRVQLAQIGHGIVGDRHYSSKEKKEKLINRPALHAWKLSLEHPSQNKEVSFSAEIPKDMQRLIDHYRGHSSGI
ncbi:MAG TPA: RNA pseudouridine synthase [Balneolales bacterium]|nr:RNA pseudouridine synthase [Balneolales bacterium]